MPGFNELSFHLHMDKKQSRILYIQTAYEVIKGSYKNMMHKEFSAALNLCLSFLLSVLSDFLCMVCSLYPFVLIHTTIIIVYLVFFYFVYTSLECSSEHCSPSLSLPKNILCGRAQCFHCAVLL